VKVEAIQPDRKKRFSDGAEVRWRLGGGLPVLGKNLGRKLVWVKHLIARAKTKVKGNHTHTLHICRISTPTSHISISKSHLIKVLN